MNRLPFVLVSLLAAACADDASPSIDDPHGPLDPLEPGVNEPAPNPRPIDDQPRTCISVDSGVARFGTATRDDLRDVIVTETGSILVAGFAGGTTSSGTGEVLGSRGVVLEYAHDLASVTPRAELRTNGTDSFDSLVRGPDGTVWLAARTTGAVPGFEAHGGFDYVLGRLSTAGFAPLARGFDSTSEHPRQLAIGPTGVLAIAGHEQRLVAGGATWIDPFLDVFTTHADAATRQWRSTRLQVMSERYDAVDVSASAIVVGGSIADTDAQGMFLAARDHDAGTLWQRQLSARGADQLAAVKILASGDVLWAATSATALGGVALGGTDLVVGLVDGATGAPRWTVQHGAELDERVTDLAVDAEGRIYLAATTTRAGGDVDAMLVVLDAQGGVVMEEQWSSDGADVPTALTVDGCGGVAIVGNTDGDLAGTPAGGRDGFVLVTRLAQ